MERLAQIRFDLLGLGGHGERAEEPTQSAEQQRGEQTAGWRQCDMRTIHLDLVAPGLVLYDASILPEHPELKVAHSRFHNEGRFACALMF